MSEPTQVEHHDVIIIGAGFGGIYGVHRLRGQGLDVLCIEAAPDVGGVWYHNAYPGARCDLPSRDYSYSFSDELQRDWFWTERYSGQPEILAYLRHVTERFDLRRSMRFNTRVMSMRRDDERDLWILETDIGRIFSANFVVLATGPLSEPKRPDFVALEEFKGELFETSRWPHRPVSFEGKTVAVIGTGPSGLQVITEIAPKVGRMTVYQRTPTFTGPSRNGPTDRTEFETFREHYAAYRREMKSGFSGAKMFTSGKKASECTPAEQQAAMDAYWEFGGIGYVWAFTDTLFDERSNEIVADYIRERMAARIEDPVLREKLMPRTYPIGTRRPCCENGYLEAFNQKNVELVDLREVSIKRFTERGIETTDGHRNFDIVIIAIGFDALTGAVTAIDPVNGQGERLSELWREGPQTYLGLGVAGFPNMFFVNGPGGASAFANVPLGAEHDIDWIGDCIAWLKAKGLSTISPVAEKQQAWSEAVVADGNKSLFMKSPSWFTGGNIPGKKRGMLMYMGGFGNFARICGEVAEKGYEGFLTASETVARPLDTRKNQAERDRHERRFSGSDAASGRGDRAP